jgi:hypothetical protein
MTETNLTEKAYGYEIKFSSFFAVLWQHRKMIVFGTLGVTLLSVVISFFLPRIYRSEGFYQLGNPAKRVENYDRTTKAIKTTKIEKSIIKKVSPIGVPVPTYKSSSTQFFNPNRFQFIASQDKSFNEEDLREIAAEFKTAEDISKWIKPLYAFAKEDTREFAQLPQDESNSVLGLKLIYEADSPKNAYNFVCFFGNYIRDCMLYVTLYNYIMDGYSNTISELNINENNIINLQFELLQNNNKLKDIRAILSNYPESAKIENRQVVSVQEGGDRFLAPVAQLVGIESALADLRQDLAELEREKEKLTVRVEYFSLIHRELDKIGERGESLFLLLKSARDEVFKNKDLSNDTFKEVFNNLSIDLQGFDFIFFSNSRFVSGPTIPSVHIKPKKGLIGVATFFSSLFLFIVLSFILNWWQKNRNLIMPKYKSIG